MLHKVYYLKFANSETISKSDTINKKEKKNKSK